MVGDEDNQGDAHDETHHNEEEEDSFGHEEILFLTNNYLYSK